MNEKITWSNRYDSIFRIFNQVFLFLQRIFKNFQFGYRLEIFIFRYRIRNIRFQGRISAISYDPMWNLFYEFFLSKYQFFFRISAISDRNQKISNRIRITIWQIRNFRISGINTPSVDITRSIKNLLNPNFDNDKGTKM